MHISHMHWQQVEACLRNDDRAVLPLGSTEQHAYLSLSTDSILAERVAVEAACDQDIVAAASFKPDQTRAVAIPLDIRDTKTACKALRCNRTAPEPILSLCCHSLSLS